MNAPGTTAIGWIEQGLVPDRAIRLGIRRLLRQRLASIHQRDCEANAISENAFAAMMDRSPIAPLPHLANEQHYEVPSGFFERVLGRHRKYSCAYWRDGAGGLDEAEQAALEITCRRARLADGVSILELGCGWGSLTLWMAEKYPSSEIVAVSNSRTQARYIEREAARRGFDRIRVVTADMNRFVTTERFDRVISIEMFEHMRNYRQLFGRICEWLHPGGLFFMHIFCHRNAAYEFLDEGPGDWMGRHFFSGGIMPSDNLPLRFQDALKLVERWRWSGRHYARTANSWLANMDIHGEPIRAILRDVYGAEQVSVWWARWRIFFMACAETFAYNHGQEWWVSHYLFSRPDRQGKDRGAGEAGQ